MPFNESEIMDLEQKLLDAMKDSNADQLEILLGDELLFTNHEGKIYSKADDVYAHRTKMVDFEVLVPFEPKIMIKEHMAIVSVGMEVLGTLDGRKIAGRFRYTRVWAEEGPTIKVIAAHCSEIK